MEVMIVVGSIFRNASSYVDRYFTQIGELRKHCKVRLVVAEGDSTDDTYDLLDARLASADTLIKVDHGGPEFGSVDDPRRWSQIAYVCNAVLDHLRLADDDKFIYVESDLVWPVDTMLYLIADLDYVDAIAAMSIRPSTGNFYDTWGHIGIDGQPFQPERPYHQSLVGAKSGRPVPIQSAGSCIAVNGRVVNAGVRFSDEDCIRGYCRTIRDHTTLFLDHEAVVFHA